MSNPSQSQMPTLLKHFNLDRILNDEPEKCRIALLGTLPTAIDNLNERVQAIIRAEKTAFSSEYVQDLFVPNEASLVQKMEVMGSTDIYTWLAGWMTPSSEKQPQGDVKINVICPATEVHVRKYTKQQSILVQETPELYEKIVKHYIASFPLSRTQWVTEILEGRAEQERILFSSPEFVILPDMKWDLHTVGSLYLVAIVKDASIRSLRDLRATHIELLKTLRSEAYRVSGEKWDIPKGGLRLFIHYQPSYYHFHVHIVNANYQDSGMGMIAGQAHLLEDVIALLELNGDAFERITLTYGLGDQHGLYESMKAVQNQ
ncbi:hypothetical protein VNI00_000608 [Paramarasmius palmivorus]|uniref:Scavenger mRNA decapping enzyme n=1 Tax=Paramarasmius palmivorus TaxID=297713 RepID=A0AAW0E9N8_9AGAR